jgi:hypothetical protein
MEEIKRLIEQRQIEAVKKQLTLKLMTVVKSLGQGIYGDFGCGREFSSTAYDPDAWLTEDERSKGGMPTANDDDYSDMGYIFDALNMGHNFEVRWMGWEKELRAKYNGHVVYLDVEGKLRAYVPNATWEGLTDRLYELAKPIDERARQKEKEESQQSYFKQAAKFLKELREAWGLKQ